MPGPGHSTTTVRRLRPGDTAVVLGASELFPTSPAPEWVSDLLSSSTALLYWATDSNGGALGFLLASLLPLPDSVEVFVYEMGLAPAHPSGAGGNASASAAEISSALIDRAAAFAEDCACTRFWGVPRPGASLYDEGGAQVSSLDIPL